MIRNSSPNSRAAEEARQQLEFEYDDYCQEETDRYIEANPTIL